MPPLTEQQVRQIFNEEFQKIFGSSNLVFQRNIQLLDGRHIQIGLTTGTKIGTSALQKIGFYGVIPVVQAGAISTPSGGGTQDAQARTAIASLITALKNVGITA